MIELDEISKKASEQMKPEKIKEKVDADMEILRNHFKRESDNKQMGWWACFLMSILMWVCIGLATGFFRG